MSKYSRNKLELLFIFLVFFAIYYLIFYSEYLYTDEASELWFFKQGINFDTSVPQGRYISYKIFIWIFGFIHSAHHVIYARVFSLLGWLVCIPIWYFILKRIMGINIKTVVFLSLVYLICMPSFTISIVWASCLEIFLAATAGLISGYILFKGIIIDGDRMHISTKTMIASLLFGLISLFTYQTGFGCFFISFFIIYIREKKFSKIINVGLISGLLIYGIYFLLFKYSVKINGLQPSERSLLAFDDPVGRIQFLLANPLAAGFHLTYLFREDSWPGKIVYYIFLSLWLFLTFIEMRSSTWKRKIIYLSGLLLFFVLIYLPFMIIKEKYSSNRTLLALNFATFLMIIQPVFAIIKNQKYKQVIAISFAIFFVGNAWYNVQWEFLRPIATEFSSIKKVINYQYNNSVDTIYFIRPDENAFEIKYGVNRSWDEFGVPSTAKAWSPEPLIRQLIFEKTKDRKIAENVFIKSWADWNNYKKEIARISNSTLLIDGSKIIFER